MTSPFTLRASSLPRSGTRNSSRYHLDLEIVERRVVLSGLSGIAEVGVPQDPEWGPEPSAQESALNSGGEPGTLSRAARTAAVSVQATAAPQPADGVSLDAATGTVQYRLSQPALVSAGIFDAQGRLVRTLFSMQPLPAGNYATHWDGSDDFGVPTPDAEYSIRLALNRNTYENVGAIGGSAEDPSVAHHIPTTMLSVAVDASGAIYTANSWDEPGADFKKWTAAGESVYDAEFKIRNGNPNGAPYRVATDDTYMYYAVGAWSGQQQVQRFRLSDGSPAPFRSGEAVAGHIQVYASVSGFLTSGTPSADAELMTSPLASLAVSGRVLYVADAAGGRVLRYDKDSGALLGQFSVALPQALAVDATGRVWVGHEHGTVSIYDPDGRPIGNAVQGLENVSAIAFGPDGRLYVADRGAGKVLVYQVDSTRTQLAWTLGQAARPGDRDPSHFFELRGVAVDSQGNIVTVQTEPAGGARLARWSPTGSLLWEHFGNEFVSLGNYGQENPDQFYSMTFHRYELLDSATGSWDYEGNTYPGGQSYSSNVHGVPRVLTIGGVEFFFDPTGDGMQIYRIDGPAFHLATLVGGQDPAPDGSQRTLPMGQWTWSDVNGTGTPAPTELRWYKPPGQSTYRTLGMDVDRTGNIWFADQATGGIWEIPLGLLDARGNPTYDWAQARQVVGRDTSALGFHPQMVQRADDGSIYAYGWSIPWASGPTEFWMGGTTLVKYDPSGNRQWAVRLPEVCTGMDTVPGTGGVIVGGGKSASLYQYTADGLRVGSVSPGAALAGISSWFDNQASVAVSRDPRDGMLDIFTEDNYGLHIGWYRVNDHRLTTLSISLTPPSEAVTTPPAPIIETPSPTPMPQPDTGTTPPVIPVLPVSMPIVPVSPPAPRPSPLETPRSEPAVTGPIPTPTAPIVAAESQAATPGSRASLPRRPVLLGTTIRAGMVELLDGRGRVLAMTVASAADGSFQIQPVRNLNLGRVRLRFRVRDASGRQSELGAPLTLNITNRTARSQAAAPSNEAFVARPSQPQRHVNRLLKATKEGAHLLRRRKTSG